MTGNDKAGPTREERLAAKLRENLRRRKEQGRLRGGSDATATRDQESGSGLSKPEDGR